MAEDGVSVCFASALYHVSLFGDQTQCVGPRSLRLGPKTSVSLGFKMTTQCKPFLSMAQNSFDHPLWTGNASIIAFLKPLSMTPTLTQQLQVHIFWGWFYARPPKT
jgi:hypothetical protein